MKILIVGGVAGGATAAARLRRLDEKSEIIMFEKGEYISFANCGLPYYIGDVIKERDNLLVQTVEGMSKKFNIDIRNFNEVIKIDKENKKVEVKNIKTNEVYEETYDKLVLSPGADAFVPPIKGIQGKTNIFTLKNISDMDKIKEYVNEKNPKKALVVGAGFIGIETAENIKQLGIDVTVVEKANQILSSLDEEISIIAKNELIEKGVNVVLGAGASEILDKEVVLDNGEKLSYDFIIMAIGVRPNSKLAVDSGLETGKFRGIKVDENLKTSDDSIYAIGDAIEVNNFITKEKTLALLASPANRQGRIVADNIYGKNMKYTGTMHTSILKVFDITAASTGLNEKALKRENKEYKVARIHQGSHAGYYPGAFPISLKLLFSNEGVIYGAQGVGYDGVDKRIDVIATAIKAGLKVEDLVDLELAYAPPYSSAKDPVNMIGYVADNIIKNELEVIEHDEVEQILKDDKNILLDVREEIEIPMGKIEGSVNIPLSELRERMSELDKEKEIFTYCQVGLRGYLAYRVLRENGYKVKNLNGGYKTYADFNEKANCIEVGDGGECITMDKTISIDACGLMCPGPIMKVNEEIGKMKDGEVLEVLVTDDGFKRDIKSWCDNTGNKLIGVSKEDGVIKASIVKGQSIIKETEDKVTMVVFNQELDKILASFIIANGARAMGKEVTMFFTFWGLNALRKRGKVKVKKDILGKMFGAMMPKGTKKLPISNMNMGGIGSKMIEMVMKKKNVDSLEELMHKAKEAGVKIVACSMSMDVMGIKKEEFIDGVEIGGVATFVGESKNLNMFL